MLDLEPQRLFNPLEERFRERILDFDRFERLFRLQIEFPYGNFRPKIAAAHAARLLVFGSAHRVTAVLADIPIFPGAVPVPFFFHVELDYRSEKVN